MRTTFSPNAPQLPLLEPELFASGPDAKLMRTLSSAIGEGRLFAQFQPIVRATNTGQVAFYECLARLNTPEHGIVSAGPIISAVEETELARATKRGLRSCVMQHAASRIFLSY